MLTDVRVLTNRLYQLNTDNNLNITMISESMKKTA